MKALFLSPVALLIFAIFAVIVLIVSICRSAKKKPDSTGVRWDDESQ